MAKTRDTANLVSHNNIYVDVVNDFVGIGSIVPTAKLDVRGNVNISGVITASSYSGDGSQLGGLGSYQFNTGISSSVEINLTGFATTVFTFPSTAGKKYILNSINCSNVAAGYTESNVIGSFVFNGGEESYFAYNTPISPNNSIEILKQPQVLNPSDSIRMRATNASRIGVSNAVQVYFSYQEVSDSGAKYQGVGLGSVGLAYTSRTVIYTSTSLPTVIQSIRLVNRTDAGDYPVSVSLSNGITTTFLVQQLIVPKYATVEICEQLKRIEIGETIGVTVNQGATIDVQLSAKKIG
jgi:hypothetical protein